MKNGFLIFLACVAALGASWAGLVLAPLLQLGGARQTVVLQSTDNWPAQRPGDAALGLQVYRANGCTACHTLQVRQDGVALEVSLNSLGSSKPEDFTAFVHSLFILPELAPFTNALAANLKDWNGGLPKVFLSTDDKAIADEMVQRVNAAGVKPVMTRLAWLAKRFRNDSASGGMSSRRSRSGGRRMVMALMR